MNQLFKKKIVALTGAGLILFVILHLSGNFLLFLGSDAYNSYAQKLHDLPFSKFLEWGLLLTFFVHIGVTFNLICSSSSVRKVSYAVVGPEGLIARTMKWSGSVIFVFIIFHLIDYAFADSSVCQTIIDGQDLGLYGLVVNSFLNSPLRVVGYIFSVLCVGLHVSHGMHSFLQTFGFYNLYCFIKTYHLSLIFGILVFVGYSSIPLYVLFIFGGFN